MDWTHYLQSIREDPKLSRWREFYTVTTVEGKTPQEKSPNTAPLLFDFDFGLMVERVEDEKVQNGNRKKKSRSSN